ncbi:ABC transporter permease [soil metagenome]
MSVLAAFVRRDLRIEKTYRLALISQVVSAGLALLSVYFLSRLVPDGQELLSPYGGDYFTFVLIGTASLSFISVGLGGFAGNLTEEQAHGTMESLFATPNDSRLLLVSGAGWPFLFATLQLALYLLVGAIALGAEIPAENLALVSAILVLSLLAFSSLGLLAASVLMVTKRGGIVVSGTGAVFALLGGVLYPISVLPGWLQAVSKLLPVTHGLEGVRLALVDSPDLGAIGADALRLVGFIVVLLPLALAACQWSTDRARRTGTIGHY